LCLARKLERTSTLLTFWLLLLPQWSWSTEIELFEDKSLPEEKELSELYHYPMVALLSLLRNAEQYCQRLPSEEEFKYFSLNGTHNSIKCSKRIKAYISDKNTGDQVGKDLPYLSDFLNRNQYQVYSNTKDLFIILKHKPSEWKYVYFKSEEYEYVIHCIYGLKKCSLNNVRDRSKSCRASKTFAKLCNFDEKKVIDY
jgi:hypothetical protein